MSSIGESSKVVKLPRFCPEIAAIAVRNNDAVYVVVAARDDYSISICVTLCWYLIMISI